MTFDETECDKQAQQQKTNLPHCQLHAKFDEQKTFSFRSKTYKSPSGCNCILSIICTKAFATAWAISVILDLCVLCAAKERDHRAKHPMKRRQARGFSPGCLRFVLFGSAVLWMVSSLHGSATILDAKPKVSAKTGQRKNRH